MGNFFEECYQQNLLPVGANFAISSMTDFQKLIDYSREVMTAENYLLLYERTIKTCQGSDYDNFSLLKRTEKKTLRWSSWCLTCVEVAR